MEMNKYIDHTLPKADVTYDKIEALRTEAKERDFASVCVNNCWVPACAELLEGTDVKAYAVADFLLGAIDTKTETSETAAAIADGARETDTVLSIGEMKAGYCDAVRADVRAAVGTVKGDHIKAISESCLLTKEETVKAYEPCVGAGVASARASTGFSTSGATSGDVKLMKDIMKGRYLVKATGGVRCYEDMEKMVEVGADRIGTSTGVKLMQKKTDDGRH